MRQSEVLTFGESMIVLSAENQIRIRGTYHSSVAGAESNVAIGLSRLGHEAVWASVLGDDEAGQLIKANLLSEGVRVVARMDSGRATGLMLRENRVGKRGKISYYRKGSAASTISSDDVLPHLDAGIKLVHVSGITPALSPESARTTLEVLTTAKQSGVLVSFDVNYRTLLWQKGEAAKALRPYLELADVITASESEFSLFGTQSIEDIASGFFKYTAALVAIKRGARGATLLTTDERVEVEAHSGEVVSTVGAGDAFCAGLLSGLLRNMTLTETGMLASSCAAFCVGNDGDWEGAPTQRDLEMLNTEPGETVR